LDLYENFIIDVSLDNEVPVIFWNSFTPGVYRPDSLWHRYASLFECFCCCIFCALHMTICRELTTAACIMKGAHQKCTLILLLSLSSKQMRIGFCQRTLSKSSSLTLVFCQTATHGGTAATAEVSDDVLERAAELDVDDADSSNSNRNPDGVSDDVLERAAELDVEHGVEDRVDGRVGVAEPEQERIQPVRKIGQ